MAKEIEKGVDQLSAFTGDKVNVAIKLGRIGKTLEGAGEKLEQGAKVVTERAGETLEVITKVKDKAIVESVKGSKIPALRSLKSIEEDKPLFKKPKKEKVLIEEENPTLENIAKQQDEIDKTFTPADEPPKEILNLETEADTLSAKINDEPKISGNQLSEGLIKAEDEINVIKQKRIPDEQLEGLPKEEIARIRKEERAGLVPPEQVFNLVRNGEIAPALKAISELAGIKTKKINRKQVAEQALAKGFDENFIAKLLDGEVMGRPEMAAQVLAAEDWASNLLKDLGAKIRNGTASDFEKLNATKTIAFHSYVLRSVKGYKTNLAQSLGMFNLDVKDYVKTMDFGLDGLRSQDDLYKFFVKYEAISNNPAAQRKLIDEAAAGSLADAGVAAVLGGMVSGTKTLVNIVAGDAPRLLIRPAITFGAAAIGAVRTLGKYSENPLINKLQLGSQNAVYFNEALSQIVSLQKGVFVGIKAASYAWREGISPIDKTLGRLDIRARPDMFDINPDSSTMAQIALGALNMVHSYGPRSVLTISEFMKGMHYQMGLDSLATRRGLEAYDMAFSITKNESKAWEAFDEAVEAIRIDPPPDIIKEAKKWTLEARAEPGSSAETLTNALNSKNFIGRIAKLYIPFATTRLNDMAQAIQMSPLGLLRDSSLQIAKEGANLLNFNTVKNFSERIKSLGKRFLDDINSGDFMKRDIALSKVGLGTGMIMYYVGEAADGKFTGAGPRNATDRANWLAQGALPFAEVQTIEGQESQTREQTLALLKAKYGESANYSVGTGEFAGKVFISHMGLSTLSAWKSMAALYHENANDIGLTEGDENDMMDMASYLMLALYEFSLNAPGIQEIRDVGMKLPSLTRDSETGFVGSAVRSGTKMALDLAVPFPVGLRREWVRAMDPAKYEYQANPDQNPVIAELINGFNEFAYGLGIKNGTVKKNIFNEPQVRDYMYSNKSLGKDSEAIQILAISGVSSKLPQRKFIQTEEVLIGDINRKVQISVPYSDKEYEMFLKLANEKEFLGGFSLKEKILNLKNNDNWINAHPDIKKAHVQSIKDSAFEYAKNVLYNPSLIKSDSESFKKDIEEASKSLNERISKEKNKAMLNLIQF